MLAQILCTRYILESANYQLLIVFVRRVSYERPEKNSLRNFILCSYQHVQVDYSKRRRYIDHLKTSDVTKNYAFPFMINIEELSETARDILWAPNGCRLYGTQTLYISLNFRSQFVELGKVLFKTGLCVHAQGMKVSVSGRFK